MKGSTAASAAFPCEYFNDFERYRVRSMVLYLTAEGGVFETTESPAAMQCGGRLVLKQVLTDKPIP